MNFEQAIARLTEKLPAGFEFQLERAAGRGPVSNAERRERKLTPFDNFTLTIECWARFKEQIWTGPASQLDQAVGAALDSVRTWQDAGEPFGDDVVFEAPTTLAPQPLPVDFPW